MYLLKGNLTQGYKQEFKSVSKKNVVIFYNNFTTALAT